MIFTQPTQMLMLRLNTLLADLMSLECAFLMVNNSPWDVLASLLGLSFFLSFFLLFFFNVYLFLRDGKRAQAGEGQREGETQNLKKAPGSELSAQSPMQGSNSQTVGSWPEPKSTLNQLRHPGAPQGVYFYSNLGRFSTIEVLNFSIPQTLWLSGEAYGSLLRIMIF